MLNHSVSTIKGVGETRTKAFLKLGVSTWGELLWCMPREYQDYSVIQDIAQLEHGALACVKGIVHKPPQHLRPRSGLAMVTATVADATGHAQLIWYNQPYRARQIKAGEQHVFSGRVDLMRGKKLINPMVSQELPGILPIYPLAAGLTQRHIRDAVRGILDACLAEVEEGLPQELRQEYRLSGLQQALRAIHFPRTQQELAAARRRLAFEDMLYYLLAIALLKKERQGKDGIAFKTAGIRERFLSRLPYQPTGAQARVMAEMEEDMRRTSPMNRLIQGDVGSGKTILAFYALAVALENGYQGALMAPTEILAQQHYALLEQQYGDRVQLLSGGLKKAARAQAYARIESGETAIVVGTHALIQAGVVFSRLGVVITDEQHRFGVRQRAAIVNKGSKTPDALVMSATPIPRTLAMLLYGDLELSVLDEMPPGRQRVFTRIVPEEKRNDMYRFVAQQAQMGKQAYVVCPLVEQSDALEARSAQEVYAELCALLPTLRIELLHGRMAAAKKEEAIRRFREGQTDILVSTTVVEVGVDVPNATGMIIENADRFGLAQLHQLRGRVGRGRAQSYCFLQSDAQSETAKERLHIMTQTNDGFLIAQKDLALRGPGEFLGTRQHGTDEVHAAKLAQNMDILLEAQAAAERIMREDTQAYAGVLQRARALYYARMRDIANN